MNDIIQIDEKYKIEFSNDRVYNLKNKIYGPRTENVAQFVEKIEWIASIKPTLGNVIPTVSESTRYEELDVFHLIINDVQELFSICKPVFKEIKYPCLLILQIDERYLLSTCKFDPGKMDYDENILKCIRISHWIFPEQISNPAKKFIDNVNNILFQEGDLQTLYTKLDNELSWFHIGGVSRLRAYDLLNYMGGNYSILEKCIPYKKYSHTGKGQYAQYTKRGKTFSYRYDVEDLWHAFITDEKINKFISARRYRDIEDLIYSIDNKLEDAFEDK